MNTLPARQSPINGPCSGSRSACALACSADPCGGRYLDEAVVLAVQAADLKIKGIGPKLAGDTVLDRPNAGKVHVHGHPWPIVAPEIKPEFGH